VAARAQRLVQPRGPVRRADRDVRHTLAGPRSPPATAAVGQDERAGRVGDRDLGQSPGGPALHGRQAGDERDHGVAYRPLHRIPHCQQADDLVGELEHAGRDGYPFLSVAVEQAVRGSAFSHEGQLPRKVVGIHHPGVHALAARR
jgi:hypothetical protein